MRLFFRLIWPRSRRALTAWIPLIVVGAIACVGLSLALGFRSGVLAQHDAAVLRDGPRGLPPRLQPADGPLRSSRLVATGYGPLVVTVFAGEAGQRLGLPGIPRVEESGTVLASPSVLAQLADDWTGELGAWLGDRETQALPDAALAHPREMVIAEFTDTVPSSVASRFYPVRAGSRGWAPDTSFVVMGLLVLVLPSVALARAGAAMHLNARSRRYGLLRVLGTPPRQLGAAIAADMAIPMLAGGLVGSVAYAAVMSSLGSFTLAGSSYWSSDLRLPITLGVALPLVVVAIGLVSAARMVHRASRDPVGTLRRERRRPVSYLSYLSAAGLLAGPIAVFAASRADFSLSVWLIVGGLLLSVVGLEGLSRLAVAFSGRALVSRTRAQIAGSRMSRSGADALLGVSATAVAVLLTVFLVYSNFDDRPPPVGSFDVVAQLEDVTGDRPLERIVRTVAGFDGVTRVVPVARHPAGVDGEDRSLYTLTCDDVTGSVELDTPCSVGSIYLSGQTESTTVLVTTNPLSGTDASIPGVYPVGGRITASWTEGRAVLIVYLHPPSEHGLLLVTTDGTPESMRHVMQGLRRQPQVRSATTQTALASGFTPTTLIGNPYLLVMATTASGMAAVALLYGVLLLFRQRQAEFRMLRCLGATRRLLAVDLGLLFAAPLTLAFGLAVAAGLALAAAYNTAFGVPAPHETGQAPSVLAAVLAIGMAATALVAGWATRIPPLVTDPDATTT